MAAVVPLNPRNTTPAGWEYNDNANASKMVSAADVPVGTLVRIEADGWHVNPTSDASPDGVVIVKSFNGEGAPNIGRFSEIDGWTPNTPSTLVYASTTVAGGIDTTANGVAIGKFITPTRIRFLIV